MHPGKEGHVGREGARDLLAGFGSSMEVVEFVSQTFAGTQDEVFTIVGTVARSRATGEQMAHHRHHYFPFCDGRISYDRGSQDTVGDE